MQSCILSLDSYCPSSSAGAHSSLHALMELMREKGGWDHRGLVDVWLQVGKYYSEGG